MSTKKTTEYDSAYIKNRPTTGNCYWSSKHCQRTLLFMGGDKKTGVKSESMTTIKRLQSERVLSGEQGVREMKKGQVFDREAAQTEENMRVKAHGLVPDAVIGDKRYRIESLLAEGGMGRIHVANDPTIGRDVAMKVLRKRYCAQPDTVARFVREARIQGQLEHPSVVPVYDLARRPSGEVFFTMQRVRGKSLEEIIDGHLARNKEFIEKYPRRRLLRAFSDVCLAVDFVHNKGVLHRDLKPANVMLGDYGEVYVLDWGLAKVAGVEEENRKTGSVVDIPGDGGTDTIDGAVLGTPGYMSPEQARGETASLDARSDIYSLGIILYEVLSLQPLHARGRVSAMMRSTMQAVDGRPSLRAPQRGIPPELDAICVKATQLDPGHRFQTAREFHDALVRYLDGVADEELTREMADSHARSAEVAANYAVSSSPNSNEERLRALREVGRALALDPSNPEARRVLFRLLSNPPQRLPDEEQREEDRRVEERQLAFTRSIGLGQMGFLALFLLLVLWMGVKSWITLITYILLFIASSTFYYLAAIKQIPRRVGILGGIASFCLAVGTMSTMFGPLFLVPTMATMAAIFGSNVTPRQPKERAWIISFSLLVVLFPLLLQYWGILPQSYVFKDGALIIMPVMHYFSGTATIITLIIIQCGYLLISSILLGRFRDEVASGEEKARMNVWQFQHLLPDEARTLDEETDPT